MQTKPGYYSLTIDPEFQKLIPPLSLDEYKNLEESLISDGCISPIIIWNKVIIDGHNRYEICKKHNLPFSTVEMIFDSTEEAMIWICRNQLGRRNISEETRKYLIGKRFETEKAIGAKNQLGINQHSKDTSVFSDEKDSKDSDISRQNKTAKKIGKEYNISHGTVEKYSRFAKSIDVIDKKVPGMADFLMSGKLKISHSNIEEISKLSPKQIKQLFVSIESYGQNTPPGIIRREFSNIKSHSNVPLAEIKKVPKYNPDSELTTLYYTIPSWCESISSTQRKVDFNAVSSEVKGKLINELKRLNKNVQSILNEITEEKNGK